MKETNIKEIIEGKETLIFDMDNTLTESCQKVDAEMVSLLNKVSENYKIVIATGGTYAHVKHQVLNECNFGAHAISVCGSRCDFYDIGEKNLWNNKLELHEKEMIRYALVSLIIEFDIKKISWLNDQIQDRDAQITFSALGRTAPKDIKDNFDKSKRKRKEWVKYLYNFIPNEYSIKIGGTTSIDICRGHPDKSTALVKLFGKELKTCLYVGDSLFNGGNDSPVLKVMDCHSVDSPEDTKEFLRKVLE